LQLCYGLVICTLLLLFWLLFLVKHNNPGFWPCSTFSSQLKHHPKDQFLNPMCKGNIIKLSKLKVLNMLCKREMFQESGILTYQKNKTHHWQTFTKSSNAPSEQKGKKTKTKWTAREHCSPHLKSSSCFLLDLELQITNIDVKTRKITFCTLHIIFEEIKSNIEKRVLLEFSNYLDTLLTSPFPPMSANWHL